jgi:hypothetical protein
MPNVGRNQTPEPEPPIGRVKMKKILSLSSDRNEVDRIMEILFSMYTLTMFIIILHRGIYCYRRLRINITIHPSFFFQVYGYLMREIGEFSGGKELLCLLWSQS